jgi:hypothetical protein
MTVQKRRETRNFGNILEVSPCNSMNLATYVTQLKEVVAATAILVVRVILVVEIAAAAAAVVVVVVVVFVVVFVQE